ncbi:MAG: helix-turn-helix transcriptional regulator [Spirochaetales bacterium]|nr:helix-turn-helix transcriptional regulator [Spirochaetales bacterium]
MQINGYFLLHISAIFISIIPAVLSLVLYLLLKERWRLFLFLFFTTGIIFILSDSIAVMLSENLPENTLSLPVLVLFVLFCCSAVFFFPVLIKLYKFGMHFVLKRWEKKYLFIFLIPFIYLLTAAFLYFSMNVFTLMFILLVYTGLTGLIIYIMSLKRIRKNIDDKKSGLAERELVFFLLTTAVLLPLDFFEYACKQIILKKALFPVNLLATPLFMIMLSLFFCYTGFKTLGRVSFPGLSTDFPITLTRREKEVAGLIIEGLTHREIAVKLFISQRTVDRHVENIYRKSGARNKTGFIRSVIPSEN